MNKELFSIKDKVILVTGAFGLIGREISSFFLEQEAKVIFAGHSQHKIDIYRERLSKKYNSSMFLIVQLEITNEKSIDECIDESLKKYGRIDVLINNAAVDAKFDEKNELEVNMSRFENYPFELIHNSINVNMLGTIQITQKVCKHMVKQNCGNIINVASAYSLISPNQTLYDYGDGKIRYKPIDYVVSKSFLANYTRYLATFYAKNNIRCNAIAPHGILNNHSKKFLDNYKRLSPMQRMCNVEELNGPFSFLVSKASSYITGITLVVDGGWSAW